MLRIAVIYLVGKGSHVRLFSWKNILFQAQHTLSHGFGIYFFLICPKAQTEHTSKTEENAFKSLVSIKDRAIPRSEIIAHDLP